ncbi:MAG: hypothetical protein ACOY4L_06950 [Pseudomonadota bacterium]
MPDHDKAPMPTSVDEAINAVLRAERQAQETIERCRQEARQRVDEARARAQRITRSTDDRIEKIRARCTQATTAQVEAVLRRNEDSDAAELTDAELERIRTAVDRLAERLTSNDDAQPGSG